MGEMGLVGIGCADATAVDDQHLLTDKLAVIQRPRGGDPQAPVSVNNYTSLTASSPKLMLNVESDDYGVIERRACRCAIGALGLDWHMHTIRSYEKLTSEGMNFLGHDLMRLVDEVLPARFGGAPTDYQFVEEDEGGLPKVSLVVSPRVGPVDEAAALDAVVAFLNRAPGATDDHGERWREARTLRVERREPYATAASKVLALHTLKLKDEVADRRGH
jgi:hypothetical protein